MTVNKVSWRAWQEYRKNKF